MHLLLFPLWSYTYYTPAINLYLSNPPISLHLLLASYKYAAIPLPQYFYTYYFLLYICTYSTPPLSVLLLLSPYISKPTNCPYISASTHLPLYIYMYCIPLYLWTYSSTIDLYLLFTPVYLQLLLFPLYTYNYPSPFLYAYIYSFLLYILIPPISILFCPHLLLSPYIPTPTDTHTNSRFILF